MILNSPLYVYLQADFGREVPAYDVDASVVEPEFQKLYSYLFDYENMGYNAEEADRPMPTAIFIVNFDKVCVNIIYFLLLSLFITDNFFLLGNYITG